MKYLRCLCVGICGLVGSALPAIAQEKPARQDFFVQCTSQGEKCDKSVRLRIPVDSGSWNLTLSAPTQHCSDLQYVVSSSSAGTQPIGKRKVGSPYLVEIWRTAWLSGGAKDSNTFTGSFGPLLVISAVGRQGGCNQGSLSSWGVGVALTKAGG